MFVIVSGPPMLRSELRDPLASLQGKIDIWILWQLAAYGFAGGLALLYLLRPLRTGFERRQIVLIVLCAMLCAVFATSALWSPSPVTTFGMSVLLGVAMLVTAQFVNTGARLGFSSLELLGALRLLAGIIIALVFLAYLLRLRGIIEWTPTGTRIRGGRLGTQQILAPVVFTISLYFLAFRLKPALAQLAWMAFALAAIWAARTRAAYITTALASLGVWILWIRAHPEHRRLMQKLLITIVAATALAVLAAASTGLLSKTWHRGGSTDTLTTLNHRTTIWAWTFKQIGKQPWGFGYSTGFRHMFLNMDEVTRDAYRYEGLVVERIGEAHNAHVEIFVSAGWIGFALYVALLAIIAFRALRALRLAQPGSDAQHGTQLVLVLLGMFMVDGMTTSSYALPTRQSLGLLLFAAGVVLILEATAVAKLRQRTAATAPRRGIDFFGGPHPAGSAAP